MKKKPHEQWLDYAADDLAFAREGLKDRFFSHVCVLSQQAVEKAMKGYLVFEGKDYPKSHDLVFLRRLMGVSWLDPHLPELKRLSEFYVPLRYPDAAGALPEGPPGEAIAKNTLQWAEEIVAVIQSHLKILTEETIPPPALPSA